ncbi:MAG: hypothetical protein JWQ40_5033 [Segetibacter sp.]|nr:hypothetical protein [Segetibacter sp.]
MLVIQCIDSQDALIMMIKHAVAEALRSSGTIAMEQEASKQEWITTPVLKTHLKEKGYSATSSLTIKKITTNFNIGTEKRGRDLWFKLSDVISIPSKI